MHRITLLAGIGTSCLLMAAACGDGASSLQAGSTDPGAVVEEVGDDIQNPGAGEPLEAAGQALDGADQAIAGAVEEAGDPVEEAEPAAGG